MRLKIFKEFPREFSRKRLNGFVLLSVRQFMTEGITSSGEYDEKYSPLPRFEQVMLRLREQHLTLAGQSEIKRFRSLHPREYYLNRVYGRASNGVTYCWVHQTGREEPVGKDYNCAKEYKFFQGRNQERFATQPVGYTGELCFLAIWSGTESHEIDSSEIELEEGVE